MKHRKLNQDLIDKLNHEIKVLDVVILSDASDDIKNFAANKSEDLVNLCKTIESMIKNKLDKN